VKPTEKEQKPPSQSESRQPIREYVENGIVVRVYRAGYAWGYEITRSVK